MKPRTRTATLGGALVATALAGVAACGSLPKDELEVALLDLAKNRGFRDVGLLRRTVEIDVDGQATPVALTYIHVAADDASTNARRTPLVLVHGTPSSLFTWSDLLFGDGALAGAFDIYVLDVVGHGLTEADVGTVGFQVCADTVAAFVASLDVGPVHVVGNSYGGEFVWRAAVDHPELFDHVVLMDSSGYTRAPGGFLPEEEAMRETWGAQLGYLINSEARIRVALEPQFQRPVSDDQVREIHLLCENAENWGAMVDLARDENGDREADIARLDRKTLLIWGQNELAYPVATWARRFESDIPDARLEVLDPCGHYPQEERPEDVARLLREFLPR